MKEMTSTGVIIMNCKQNYIDYLIIRKGLSSNLIYDFAGQVSEEMCICHMIRPHLIPKHWDLFLLQRGELLTSKRKQNNLRGQLHLKLSQPQYKTLVNKVHPSMQTTPLPDGLDMMDMIISDLHLIQVVFFWEISNSHWRGLHKGTILRLTFKIPFSTHTDTHGR